MRSSRSIQSSQGKETFLSSPSSISSLLWDFPSVEMNYLCIMISFFIYRSLLEAGGVDRLMMITRHRQRFSSRVVKFASQVLYSMWVHQELREVYRKAGWKETDFVTKTIAARNARPNSPTNLNSTLNRPMASQSGTRYEDRTMQRGASSGAGGSGDRSGGGGGGAIAAHMNNSAAGYMVRHY